MSQIFLGLLKVWNLNTWYDEAFKVNKNKVMMDFICFIFEKQLLCENAKSILQFSILKIKVNLN